MVYERHHVHLRGIAVHRVLIVAARQHSVADVNTVNYHGKRKSRYTKAGLLRGRMNHFKKAYITLAGEDKIDFYANI